VSAVVRRKNGKRVVVIKKRTKAVHQSKTGSRYFPRPNLPDKPKVTVGAKSYGRTKLGGYIVPRFWITQVGFAKTNHLTVKPSDPWYVVDMEEANIAQGTKTSGYKDKKEAIKIARKFRDEFGAWSVMPF
jgi:hypothetical protein